jgi:hypothetical protein
MDKKQEAYNSLVKELDELIENRTLPKLDYMTIEKHKNPTIVTNIPMGNLQNLYITINDNGDRQFYDGAPQSGKMLNANTLQDIVSQLSPADIENMIYLVQDFNERLNRNRSSGGRGLS